LCDVASKNKTLKKQMDKLITTYYIVKDDNG